MFIPLMMLAVEANGVVALRMMTLMSGNSDTLHESHLLFSEKIDAAFMSQQMRKGWAIAVPLKASRQDNYPGTAARTLRLERYTALHVVSPGMVDPTTHGSVR
jgi:hypothetical protein